MPRTYPSLEHAFWAKVERRAPDECWPWTGKTDAKGYAQFKYGGRYLRGSRIAWSVHHGRPVPDGMLACHTCDNPSCANPKHIWIGTPRDNVIDMMRKGRWGGPRNLNRDVSRDVAERWPEICLTCGHRRDDDYVYGNIRRCRRCKVDRAKQNKLRAKAALTGATST